ncbi:hypothetical protein IU451_29035 [Nocardia cyriacigeorgica]|uniref:hypothetical protein n=1 Tax=Nocardia cyriacigeorgica TaxID=135487 RepID=UPI00189472A0|nr:hypothetical protein [Nocardia cyriacigeorgica]MBF6326549.1 hypothetical protein [Nocardia cyriacigeorgica]
MSRPTDDMLRALIAGEPGAGSEGAISRAMIGLAEEVLQLRHDLAKERAAYGKLHADTQEGWARIAARQQRDAQRILDLEQQLAGGGAS